MSKKDAREFIDLLHTDAATRNAVHDAAEKIADIAKAKGYKASRRELSDALKDHWSQTAKPAGKPTAKPTGKKTAKHTCTLALSEAPGF